MRKVDPDVVETVVAVVYEALARGARVNIDGLGAFVADSTGTLQFEGCTPKTKIFITYVHEDWLAADRLYTDLTAAGFDCWMDRRKLMPGQNWPRAIEDALSISDFVLACFSSRSVDKKGGFQAELRYALDCAKHMPLDRVFLIPVRLDGCRIPVAIQRETQYVDLFPQWDAGFARVLGILRKNPRPRNA